MSAEKPPKFDVNDQIKTYAMRAAPHKVIRITRTVRYLYLVETEDGSRKWLGEKEAASFEKVVPNANAIPET